MASLNISGEGTEQSSGEELGDGQLQDGASKKKKFKPFKAVRRLFSSRRKKPTKPVVVTRRMESVSDDDTLEQPESGPAKLSSNLSMSADSIFTPESQKSPVDVERLKEGAQSMERLPPSRALTAELKGKLKGRKIDGDDDDEDDGLPASPPAHTTTADVLMQMQGNQSAGSEKSLLSMDSSENETDDQDVFQKRWTYGVLPTKEDQETRSPPQRQNSGKKGEIDLDVVHSEAPLSSTAAKSKMQLRQKTKAPSRRARNQSPSSPPADSKLTLVEEESPMQDKDISLTASVDSLKEEKQTVAEKEVRADTKPASPQPASKTTSPVEKKVELSPSEESPYGEVVLRKRKEPMDASRRQTVAVGSGVSALEEMHKSKESKPRNWDDLDKPKPPEEPKVDANSEFAQLLNKFNRRASGKFDTTEAAQKSEGDSKVSKANSQSKNVRDSLKTIDIKLEEGASKTSLGSSPPHAVKIDMEKKDKVESPGAKKGDQASVQSIDVKGATKGSPSASLQASSQDNISKSREKVNSASSKSEQVESSVVMRDSSTKSRPDRSSVKSIDIKIDKLSVKSNASAEDSSKAAAISGSKKVELAAKDEVKPAEKTSVKAELKQDDSDYQKPSPKLKDQTRSQTLPETSDMSKVTPEKSSPPLQRSKTEEKDTGSSKTPLVQPAGAKSEPKKINKIFQRTMEDGSTPPWFKAQKETQSNTKPFNPRPKDFPVRITGAESKDNKASPTSPAVDTAKTTPKSPGAATTLASSTSTTRATKVSSTTPTKTTSSTAMTSKATGSTVTAKAESKTASAAPTKQEPAKAPSAASQASSQRDTTVVPSGRVKDAKAAFSSSVKDVKPAGSAAGDKKEEVSQSEPSKPDTKEDTKVVAREKPNAYTGSGTPNRQSKVLDLIKNFQNVQQVS